MTINCMGPVFKECELTQTPDTLMKSFFTNIDSEKLCENVFEITQPTPSPRNTQARSTSYGSKNCIS